MGFNGTIVVFNRLILGFVGRRFIEHGVYYTI